MKKANFFKNEEGSILILMSLLLVALLGITGIVIDGGILYTTKAHLQKTANAAALSGAQELLNENSAVSSVIDEILKAHNEENSLVETIIDPNPKVSVHLKKDVPLAFMRLLGFDHYPVEATSTAQLAQIGSGKGATPLGIDESIPLVFLQEYTLKMDESNSSNGYFGILDFGENGGGASEYESYFKYGYPNEIKVGDIIDTQTGNVVGPTRAAVDYRIDTCPYASYDKNHRDCPRILLVPIYRPYEQDSGQLKRVEITGFAYFYLLEPMSMKDKTVHGMFIQRVGSGLGNGNAVNMGAYGVKLTK